MASRIKAAKKFYEGYHSSFVVDESLGTTRRDLHTSRSVVKSLGIPPGSSLLDLSCGQGLFLKAASEAGVKVTGLDLSTTAIAGAKARLPGARLVVGNAEKVPFKSGAFDWVTCLGSLEHYEHPEKALKEIRRVLKPDGRAAIYVPNLFFLGYVFLVWRTGEPPHEATQNEFERFETRLGWEAMFKRQGFEILKTSKFNDMRGTQRLPVWLLWLYQALVRPFVPLNLSYCFMYTLKPRK